MHSFISISLSLTALTGQILVHLPHFTQSTGEITVLFLKELIKASNAPKGQINLQNGLKNISDNNAVITAINIEKDDPPKVKSVLKGV
jgi:hypothetical protein